jgi:hypothetical protein
MPMAPKDPMMVDTTVETAATKKVFLTADKISASSIKSWYQIKEKLSQLPLVFPSLKEKTMRTTIGAYKNA